MQVETIATEALGDRSYVVHDGTTALVIDPQRDLDRVESLLAARGLVVGAVAETHIHNDYVTGGFELALRSTVPYLVNAEDPVAFERTAVRDGDELRVGGLVVRVLATPGHTATHLSYAVRPGPEGAGGDETVVFTGGSLLYGTVGRTDLVDPECTVELAHSQYHSARRLVESLPAQTGVFPTHGFGSFCSAGASSGRDGGTLADEQAENEALLEPDEDAFVERVVSSLTAHPAYYAHMAPANLAGPGPIDLSPPARIEPRELAKRLAAGEWVVDLRDRTAYAAEHLHGAVHIPLHQLLDRLDEIPDRQLWVHCQSAYRASIAASLLDRAGRDVVLIADDFARAHDLGLVADTTTEGESR